MPFSWVQNQLLGKGGPSRYRTDQMGYMDKSYGAALPAFRDNLSKSTADYSAFRPEAQQGYSDYKGYLSRDPYMTGMGAVLRGQFNRGIADQMLGAGANLANSQARAGITGPMAVAQRAALNIGGIKARAGADNAYLMNRMNADAQRRSALFGLISGENQRRRGEMGQDFQQLTAASQPYVSYYDQMAQQDEANKAAGRNAVMGLLGGVGQIAAGRLFPSSFDKYLKMLGGGAKDAPVAATRILPYGGGPQVSIPGAEEMAPRVDFRPALRYAGTSNRLIQGDYEDPPVPLLNMIRRNFGSQPLSYYNPTGGVGY